MNIMLIERVVERCNDPASPNYLKVQSMSTKFVCDYVSNIIPRKGEVIFIDDNKIYDVVEVIYQTQDIGQHREPVISVHVEVKPHVATHTYQATNYSFEEDWPLVSNLPTDLSWYKQDKHEEDDDDPYYV